MKLLEWNDKLDYPTGRVRSMEELFNIRIKNSKNEELSQEFCNARKDYINNKLLIFDFTLSYDKQDIMFAEDYVKEDRCSDYIKKRLETKKEEQFNEFLKLLQNEYFNKMRVVYDDKKRRSRRSDGYEKNLEDLVCLLLYHSDILTWREKKQEGMGDERIHTKALRTICDEQAFFRLALAFAAQDQRDNDFAQYFAFENSWDSVGEWKLDVVRCSKRLMDYSWILPDALGKVKYAPADMIVLYEKRMRRDNIVDFFPIAKIDLPKYVPDLFRKRFFNSKANRTT